MATAGEHGRPAFAEGDRASVWENGTIAPHSGPGRAGGFASDGVACADSVERLKIVTDVECTFTLGAEGLRRRGGDGGLAAGAFKIFDLWHGRNDNRWRWRETAFGRWIKDW